MNISQTKGEGAPKLKGVRIVEWLVDAPSDVEVRVRRRPRDRLTQEMIRYVKLAVGIFDYSPAGGVAGLYRNRRTRRLVS